MVYKKKIIVSFLLAITLLSVAPVKTVQAGSDYGASTWAVYFKNVMVKAAAQAAFKTLSNQIISKIQKGGRGGKAAFVQNWINFATQAQYQGEGIFRAELANNSRLCSYLSDGLKKAFGVDPKKKIPLGNLNTRTDSLQSFGLATACTMPKDFTLQKYQQDFVGNGGWDAFSRMLEPQNNAWGLVALSQDEITKQRQLSQSAAINQALSGNGFMGLEGSCKTLGLGNVCLRFGDIKTPGSTLDRAVGDATTGGTTALLAAADGASIAVGALTTWAINKIFEKGLAGSTDDSTDVSISSEQRDAESYAQEFCTAAGNISFEATAYILKNFPQAYRDFPPGNGGGSHCQSLYDTKNSYPYSRCSQACLKAVGESPSLAAPSVPPAPIPPPSGGGGVCVDTGNPTANYAAQLSAAESAVLNSNPTLANSLNDIMNSTEFVNAVVLQLRSSGLLASGSVKSGNDVTHTENLVAIWQSGDITIERYEAVNHAGDGDMTIRNAAQAEYSGDIPMSCAN